MSRTMSLAIDLKANNQNEKDIEEIAKEYDTFENPLIKEIEIFNDFQPVLAHDDPKE